MDMKKQIVDVMKMSTGERNILLCKLSVKEMFNTIELHESIQLATIHTIRTFNGEVDSVLEHWKKHPETDPRQ
jgi:hypothetical protein